MCRLVEPKVMPGTKETKGKNLYLASPIQSIVTTGQTGQSTPTASIRRQYRPTLLRPRAESTIRGRFPPDVASPPTVGQCRAMFFLESDAVM